MIDQLLKIGLIRENILIFWGAHDSNLFCELDVIDSWIKQNINLKCILATKNILEGFNPPI
jgi:hypothetical protein